MIPGSIDIRIPRDHALRWHAQLRDRLARSLPKAAVSLSDTQVAQSWPEGVGALLGLERLLLRRSRPTLSDSIILQSQSADVAADVVIDLVGDTVPGPNQRVLRALYDAAAPDRYAVAALLAGAAPSLALLDVGANVVVAQGRPSLEAADGLTGGLEAVYSRMALLIERALLSPPEAFATPQQISRDLRSPIRFALRSVAYNCARAIYHLCCHSPHWRVGWRFVDGPGLLDERGPRGGWRVMQDREMSFAADPFPCEWDGARGVFYERLDYATNKGAIFYQPFGEAGPVGEPTPVLEEPWHLSYPFLITEDGQLYMVPEASGSGAITLYRCIEYPGRWEAMGRLVDGVEAADATIFKHNGRYWMTSVIREGVGGYSDTLAIHYADKLTGPWHAHAQRPVLIDSRYARPAGWVIESNGALLRPVQDCAHGYGLGLYVMRIDALTPDEFAQTPLRRIPPGDGWPGKRLHTINRRGRLECIDGVVLTPKPLAARRFTHAVIDRRILSDVTAAN